MSNLDVFNMAVKNLFKRKLRTFLTILGVIIGTVAIVIMVSLGIALNEGFEEQLSQWGDIKVIRVYSPNDYWYAEDDPYNTKNLSLDEAAVNKFKEIDGVVAATGFVDLYLKFVAGKYQASLEIRGIDPESMAAFDFVPAEGRLLEQGDKMNLVFGCETPHWFYNPNAVGRSFRWFDSEGDPDVDVMTARMQMSYDWNLGSSSPYSSGMAVKPYNVSGVGILESKDYMTDSYVYMNIKEVEKIRIAQQNYENAMYNSGGSSRRNTNTGYSQAYVKCADIDAVRKVEAAINDMGFNSYSATQQLDMMSETSKSMQVLLGAIGAVSLFVAAIGITNTMVMAIYERTREIGVMKVIGAAIKDIKKLFLVEASLIGFFGGTFGVIFSLIVSHILNEVGVSFFDMMGGGSKVSSVPPWLCGAALIFAASIGLISGYFPAKRATKLSALSAIRTE